MRRMNPLGAFAGVFDAHVGGGAYLVPGLLSVLVTNGHGEDDRPLRRHPQIEATLLGIGHGVALALTRQGSDLSVGQVLPARTLEHLFRHQKFPVGDPGYHWATNRSIISLTQAD
jgi:hypothetical protein